MYTVASQQDRTRARTETKKLEQVVWMAQSFCSTVRSEKLPVGKTVMGWESTYSASRGTVSGVEAENG